MERSRCPVPPGSVTLRLQGVSTTASIRSGLPSRAQRRARDGSFVLLLQKGRSASPSLPQSGPSPLPPRLRLARSGQRGVEECDAPFDGRPKKSDHLLLVWERSVGKAHSHAAEPESRDFQVTVSKCALLHSSCLLSLSKGRNDRSPRSDLVLFVADLFHPVDGLAVETFLNGDVRHGRGWRGTMPMFLSRLKPDHVPRTNVLDWTTPALDPAIASRHNQGLAQGVSMPGGPSARLERDTGADHACRIGCLEQGVNTYRAGKVLDRSFTGRL